MSVNDATFFSPADPLFSDPDQTCANGLWDTVTSWGRKIKPILPKFLTGTTAAVSFCASSFFLLQQNRYTHFTPATEQAIEAICWTNLGLSTRIMIELFSSSNKEFYSHLQQVHNTTTGLAHWCFFALWNISLNVQDKVIQQNLYGVIATLFGYNITNDCIQALKSSGYAFIDLDEKTKDELENSLLSEHEKERSLINHGDDEDFLASQNAPLLLTPHSPPSLLLEPVFTDAKKVLLYQALKISCGGLIAFVNHFQNPKSDLYLLVNTLGYFLIGSGIGEIGMEGLTHLQKKVNTCTTSNSTCSRLGKWGMKAINLSLEIVPVMVIEVNTLFKMFNPGNNAMGILVGTAYGKTKYDYKREFQELTSEIHNAKKRNNQVPQTDCWEGLKENKIFQALGLVEEDRKLKTALLIDRIITVPLYLGLTGFTVAVALDTDSVRLKIAISTLLASTIGMTGCGALLKKYFKPGENSRVFNELYFNFFENTEFLPLLYSVLTQIGEIDDESISKHNDLQYAFSLLGMATFGSLLSLVRVESGDSYRNPAIYSSPIYRMFSWLTLIKLFKGE